MAGELFGDYSRIPIPDPLVRSLYIQQGRVVLDSDANEQTATLLRQLRRLTRDLVGAAGGPEAWLGFRIGAENGGIVIGSGRYYVEGLPLQISEPTGYYDQADAFLDADLAADELPDLPFILYLRVWERTITAIEAPEGREVALGQDGPDTITRNRVVWQVRATRQVFGRPNADLTNRDELMTAWDDWEAHRDEDRVALRARASRPAGADDDPCPTPPSSRYRGVENQLYRVEVHAIDATADPRRVWIKWSRDNGSATYPIETLNGRIAGLTTLGRDRGLRIDVGDWVEVIDDRYMLYPGAPSVDAPFDRQTAPLLRVIDVEPLDRTVTLSEEPEGTVGRVPARHPFLRRWDQQPRPKAAENVVELATSSLGVEVAIPTIGDTWTEWIDLEDGVQVAFHSGQTLRIGDYWLIPARTETGDVIWPTDEGGAPVPQPPLGIDYSFAPLAVVSAFDDANIMDLRKQFAPLSDWATL